jgi:hypothetical protein
MLQLAQGMLKLAQDVAKSLFDRLRSTLRVVVTLAESAGVPPALVSVLQRIERVGATDAAIQAPSSAAGFTVETIPPQSRVESSGLIEEKSTSSRPQGSSMEKERKRASWKKRGLVGAIDLSDKVKPLEVDDEISGSTYLARIIWSLGVAELEGPGPLRPADIARMIMSRSPVSLEPPNVARYIRRSQPTSIIVAKTDGSSNFYALNEEGHALFNAMFRIDSNK